MLFVRNRLALSYPPWEAGQVHVTEGIYREDVSKKVNKFA